VPVFCRPHRQKVRLAAPTGAGAAAGGADCNPNTPGVGALVPVKLLVFEPNLFAGFGFGKDVNRSDCEKAVDRAASDFGLSSPPLSVDTPVLVGES